MSAIYKTICFLLLLSVLGSGLWRLGQIRYPISRNPLEQCGKSPVLMIAGSSHGGDVDEKLLEVPAVNLSMDGADIYEMSYRLRYAASHYQSIRYAVIVLSPFTFYYNNSYLIEEGGIRPRAANRVRTYIEYPMWKLQDGDLADFIMARLYPLVTFDHWGQCFFPEEPSQLSVREWTEDELDKYARLRVDGVRKVYANMKKNFTGDLTKAAKNTLLKTIAFLRARNVVVVMITPPYWKEYNSLLEDDFLRGTRKIAREIEKETGVRYSDYSRHQDFSSNMDLFFDSDHLNKKGTARFHALFVRKLAELPGYPQKIVSQSSTAQ